MKALLVEDQPLIVAGFRAVMGGFPAAAEIECAESPARARDMLASDPRFDLVVLDLELEGAGGLDFLGELRSTIPAVPIVVLSGSNANQLVSRAIFMGAMGFVLKRAANATLVEALQLVLSGVVYVPPMKARSQPSPGSGPISAEGGWGTRPTGLPTHRPSATRSLASMRGLTARQTDVLELLLLGQSNKLIARALNLSIDTVKDHVTSVLRGLNVNSRTQVVLAMGRLSGKTRPPAEALPW